MIWVLVFVLIAVGGLIWLAAWIVWLAHKASDVFSELTMLGDRGRELADLAGQIELPGSVGAPSPRGSGGLAIDG